jgi:hypothetical protein
LRAIGAVKSRLLRNLNGIQQNLYAALTRSDRGWSYGEFRSPAGGKVCA